MEMLGISNEVMEANSFHGQIALNAQLAKEKLDTQTTAFNKAIKDQKSGDSSSNLEEEAKDAPTLNAVYNLGKGVSSGAKGAAQGASEAYSLARSGVASVASRTGAAVTNEAGGLSEAAQSSFLTESSSVAQGTEEGASVGRSALSGAAAGARGFVGGLAEAGGEGASFGSKLVGVEGIAQTITETAGAGSSAAFVAGRLAGAAGGIISAGKQIDSLIESNGKSAFTRVNEQGQRVAMSGTDKAGEFLSEAAAGADILAGASGGLFVPVAAALNLAGAVTSLFGSYEDEKTDDKAIGLNADGTTDASAAPKLSAPPQTEAFTGLGFIGNMTHNPLAHIA